MVDKEEISHHSIILLDPKTEIEAILFDMDGVLVDSVPLHIKAWNTVLSENNLPGLDRNAYVYMLGRTNIDMLTRYQAWHKINIPFPKMKKIIASKENYFRAYVKDGVKTAPGVIKWLDYLRKNNIHCSVASSGEMSNIAVVLEMLQISDYFTSIISGAHLPASKPDPMIFKLAAASLGVKPDNCIVIEDAPAGIQAAKAAKMLCCALATTHSFADLQEADILLENLAQADPESLFTN